MGQSRKFSFLKKKRYSRSKFFTLINIPKTIKPSNSSDAAAACGVRYRLVFHVTICNYKPLSF